MRDLRSGVPAAAAVVVMASAAFFLTSPAGYAQGVSCTGINTNVPHNETAEPPEIEACEQLQGTELAETAVVGAAAPSAQAAGFGAVRAQTLAVTNAISERIRAISRDLARGLGSAASRPAEATYRGIAAGSPDSRWGVWGDASGSFLRDNASVGYNGPSVVALAGADYILAPDWIVGFSSGYTHANLALRSITGSRASNGAVVAPYASYILSPNLSLDGQFNYTRLSNNVMETGPGPSSAFGSNRLTGAVNLNGYFDTGPIKLTGFTGYTYSWEGSSKTVLSNVPPFSDNLHYGVFRVGGEAGYQFEQFEAYVPLTFEYETTRPQDGTSRAALVVGAGLRYQWGDQLKAGFLATTSQLKTHWQDVKLEANLRWTF